MKTATNPGWDVVTTGNRTYLDGALTQEEGQSIRWHSPSDERSSQVFCISAFGTLRRLPDRDTILARLFSSILSADANGGDWTLTPEYTAPELLGETGQGTPSSIDIFCRNAKAAACIESKFLYDALEGFGPCGQTKHGDCEGFYGPGSDHKTGTSANCRLEVRDGRRDPRRYWELGRRYFLDTVFEPQAKGQTCPLAGHSFQLMRNFLFAAQAASPAPSFGVLCMVPEKTAARCREQVDTFKAKVLRNEFQSHIAVETYDTLAGYLLRSAHDGSQSLGRFLQERMSTLL